jgi:hypothetical protein
MTKVIGGMVFRVFEETGRMQCRAIMTGTKADFMARTGLSHEYCCETMNDLELAVASSVPVGTIMLEKETGKWVKMPPDKYDYQNAKEKRRILAERREEKRLREEKWSRERQSNNEVSKARAAIADAAIAALEQAGSWDAIETAYNEWKCLSDKQKDSKR